MATGADDGPSPAKCGAAQWSSPKKLVSRITCRNEKKKTCQHSKKSTTGRRTITVFYRQRTDGMETAL